jgi:hypothetical protein
MASVLHGSARTTPCLRAEFQASQENREFLNGEQGISERRTGKRSSEQGLVR